MVKCLDINGSIFWLFLYSVTVRLTFVVLDVWVFFKLGSHVCVPLRKKYNHYGVLIQNFSPSLRQMLQPLQVCSPQCCCCSLQSSVAMWRGRLRMIIREGMASIFTPQCIKETKIHKSQMLSPSQVSTGVLISLSHDQNCILIYFIFFSKHLIISVQL